MTFLVTFLVVIVVSISMINGFNRHFTRKSYLKVKMSDSRTSDEIASLKSKLFELAAKTNRGESASSSQKESIADIIYSLEAMNPSLQDNSFSLLGDWELIYTDAQLFMSSPFFLTLREFFGIDSEQADRIFKLHRAATNTGILDDNKVIALVVEPSNSTNSSKR